MLTFYFRNVPLFIRCKMEYYQLSLGLRFFFFLGFSGCCSSIGLISVADGSIENKEDNASPSLD